MNHQQYRVILFHSRINIIVSGRSTDIVRWSFGQLLGLVLVHGLKVFRYLLVDLLELHLRSLHHILLRDLLVLLDLLVVLIPLSIQSLLSLFELLFYLLQDQILSLFGVCPGKRQNNLGAPSLDLEPVWASL